MQRRSIHLGALVLALLITGAYSVAQPPARKRPLSITDLYLFDSPTSLALAPQDRAAVYVRHWIDPDSKLERHSLWVVLGDREKVRPVETGEFDARAPVFSPDGKWVAILSTRPRPEGWAQTPPAPQQSDPATDIWLIPAAGGEVVPLAGPFKPYGRVFNDGFYGRIAFSPDSKKIAFIADDGQDPRTPQEIRNEVTIVRPDQGEGYTGYGPAQLWVATLDPKPGQYAASRISRLTRDDVWYGDPQWSPDGKSIVVHANKTDDRESVRYSINKNFDLWSVDLESAQFKKLPAEAGPEVSPRFSPDGKRVACLAIPRKGSHRDVFNLVIVDLEDAKKSRVVFDYHGKDADKAPYPPPVFPLPQDCWDGDGHIVYNAEVGTGTQMIRIDLSNGRGDVWNPASAKPDESTFAQRWQLRQQLTPRGNLFLNERVLGESKVVHWKSDGRDIDGILTVPPAEVAKAPYELIVHPHGGPHSRSALGFDFTVQVLAANGYAVFQPNFRGSSGYGQQFVDADRSDFGGGDMRDIMSGVDELIRQKIADKDKLFVYGTSYGGFMTTWLVGQTERFKAAVAQNAVTDLNMMWGLSDLQSWTEWEFHGKPWEVPDLMRKHSPLTYADGVKTPTLILHSANDRRVPIPMGRAFYQALLSRGVPTQMVIYPDEGHGIKQPRHREDVLRRMLDWFAEHQK